MEVETEKTSQRDGRPGSGFAGFAACRLHEVERVIILRHGGPCGTGEAGMYFALAVHSLVALELRHIEGRIDPVGYGIAVAGIAAWCAKWLPGLPRTEMVEVINAAITEPRRLRADTAAAAIRLTMSERTAAGITTIGATDVNADERAMLRKLKQAADAQARRDAAAREFIGPHPEAVKDACARLGISRATLYRRRTTAAAGDADAAERARLSRERQAARSRARRAEARAAGEVKPRAEYEAASVAAECRRLGISRTTFYRRRAAEAAKPTETSPSPRSQP